MTWEELPGFESECVIVLDHYWNFDSIECLNAIQLTLGGPLIQQRL